jgi:uncharacterized protein involved in cysteine biosynthesis
MEMSSEMPVSSTRISMTAGAVIGLLMVLIQVNLLINLLVFTGGIYYTVRLYRKKRAGDVVYSQLLTTGIQTAFFTSVILAFVIYLVAKVIDPSVMAVFVDMIEQTLRSSETPSEILSVSMEQIREQISPELLAVATIIQYTLIGSVIAAICGFILRNPVQFDNQHSKS